jgi:hypothetical protein
MSDCPHQDRQAHNQILIVEDEAIISLSESFMMVKSIEMALKEFAQDRLLGEKNAIFQRALVFRNVKSEYVVYEELRCDGELFQTTFTDENATGLAESATRNGDSLLLH